MIQPRTRERDRETERQRDRETERDRERQKKATSYTGSFNIMKPESSVQHCQWVMCWMCERDGEKERERRRDIVTERESVFYYLTRHWISVQ